MDPVKGFVYYSFTTLLVKTDLNGKLVGTVGGFAGHLGDLDFNPADGRVYGSLEYKQAEAFYIAIFDVAKIDRVNMRAQNSTVLSTVYLPEVVRDFTADLDGDGAFAGDTADTADHRYGCSGIDGLTFGPRFGSASGKQYLTVAYGIYRNDDRTDNDYQILLQYDVKDWSRFAHPLVEGRSHHAGPPDPAGKYFILTGNTRFGVQNLDYDASLERWLLAVYPGDKGRFPNYALYEVSASAKPRDQVLDGLAQEKGWVLPLAAAGLRDPATGIRGWRRQVPFGIQSLGDGLYYLAASTVSEGRSSATLNLERWTGDPEAPFASGR